MGFERNVPNSPYYTCKAAAFRPEGRKSLTYYSYRVKSLSSPPTSNSPMRAPQSSQPWA